MKPFFIKVPIYEVIIRVENDKTMDKQVGVSGVVSDGCYLLKLK